MVADLHSRTLNVLPCERSDLQWRLYRRDTCVGAAWTKHFHQYDQHLAHVLRTIGPENVSKMLVVERAHIRDTSRYLDVNAPPQRPSSATSRLTRPSSHRAAANYGPTYGRNRTDYGPNTC